MSCRMLHMTTTSGTVPDMSTHTLPTILTTAQVAARIERTPTTVRRMVDAGLLRPAARVPGKNGTYLFLESEVDAFISRVA
jgi:hypothetical protein